MGRKGSSRRVLVVASLLALVLPACDWTSFGFDAGNTRFNRGETAIGAGNVGGLVEQWRSTVLTGGGAIRGTPAVAKGLLFTQAGGSSGNGRLAAYDAAGVTGCTVAPKVCTPQWQSSNVLPSSYNDPTVANGKVTVCERHVTGSFQNRDARIGIEATQARRCRHPPATPPTITARFALSVSMPRLQRRPTTGASAG